MEYLIDQFLLTRCQENHHEKAMISLWDVKNKIFFNYFGFIDVNRTVLWVQTSKFNQYND